MAREAQPEEVLAIVAPDTRFVIRIPTRANQPFDPFQNWYETRLGNIGQIHIQIVSTTFRRSTGRGAPQKRLSNIVIFHFYFLLMNKEF